VYAIKEIYYTIQGEGFHSGRAAVFCRFAGCNLWNGLEKDRHKAICKFCDTEFFGTDGVNGGKYSAEELTELLLSIWEGEPEDCFVVFTGGEPALQMDDSLISVLKAKQIEIAIETNGTIKLPEGIDWICVSPKANTTIEQTSGHELKLVYPQIGQSPEDFEDFDFEHLYLQPLFDANIDIHTVQTINYCRENPHWKLSLQTHKILGIP
jgi:7-carboxy-7-deazaguanine synthase (Cx14CxxC type)